MLKKRTIKIVVALLLCLVMVANVSAIPAKASDTINYVSVNGIDAPITGQYPDMEPFDFSDVKYELLEDLEFEAIEWFDVTDPNNEIVLSEDDTFVKEHDYKIVVRLQVKSGYEFGTLQDDSTKYSGDAYINGIVCSASKIYGYQAWYALELSYTFSDCPTSRVREVGVTIAEPRYGYEASNIVIYDATYYRTSNEMEMHGFDNGVLWKDVAANSSMESGDTFEFGKEYYVTFYIKTVGDYQFDAVHNMTFTINGIELNENQIKYCDSDTCLIGMSMDCYGTISYTSCNVTAPQIGAAPDYDVYNGTSNIQWTGWVYWYDETAGEGIASMDKFQAGHVYSVEISMCANNLYRFYHDEYGNLACTSYINGVLADSNSASTISGRNYLTVKYTFPALPESYTVTFDANGGSGTIEPLVTYNSNYEIPECSFTPPAGKKFKTWELNGVAVSVGEWVVLYENNVMKAIWEDVSTGSGSEGGNSGSGAGGSQVDVSQLPEATVAYRTHVQSIGWQKYVTDGVMAGTSGIAKRLEGIEIFVGSADPEKELDLGIQYTTHCQSYGWLPWSADGDMSGTEGEAKRLEAIMIKLTGADAEYYDVYYRVHAQSYGWLGWAKDGAPAGTAGYGKRLEGIQIVVVKKDASFDKEMGEIKSIKDQAFVAKEGKSPIVNYPATSNTAPVVPGEDMVNVSYRTHVQKYGWQGWKYNGAMSGTSGEAKRLEGIEIKLTNTDYNGGIAYCTHVQTYAWQGADLNDP
ncbi:MAG: hypothetical protein IJO70_10740, partial [Lachnospiraceae bacterium]|nr:hypothetical protein [Lachnospiraceae bacterium]